VAAETAATNAAVRDTARAVVTFRGAVAQTFFFSSSGGRTATLFDEWGSQNVRYLRSVDDHTYDKYSPNYRWGPLRYTQAGVARHVTAPAGFNDLVVTRNGSGRAGSVALVGSMTRRIRGAAFQSAFGLRSTRFWIGVLRLRGPRHVASGTRIWLSGFERHERRGLGIQQRVVGGHWQTAAVGITPNRDGTFVVKTKPRVTTFYRAISSHGSGAAIRVAVTSG
jgi:SpoIID/LytB domain protein